MVCSVGLQKTTLRSYFEIVVTLLGGGPLGLLELCDNSETDSVGIGLMEKLTGSNLVIDALSFCRCFRMVLNFVSIEMLRTLIKIVGTILMTVCNKYG